MRITAFSMFGDNRLNDFDDVSEEMNNDEFLTQINTSCLLTAINYLNPKLTQRTTMSGCLLFLD